MGTQVPVSARFQHHQVYIPIVTPRETFGSGNQSYKPTEDLWPHGYSEHRHFRDDFHMHGVILEFWKGTVCLGFIINYSSFYYHNNRFLWLPK